MITVRFPSMLHAKTGRELTIAESLRDVGALLDALEQRFPGLGRELNDPIYNFAVNDEMLLHGVRSHVLQSGDVVEIVPTIAGGDYAQS
jgi:molybdopterin converting factor small subunit